MQLMNRSAPSSNNKWSRNIEDEKKYKKALRFIYKYGQETNDLTDEAYGACKRQNLNPEDLLSKTLEDFAVHS